MACGLRKLVPRAYELAVVAAVDAVADGGAQLDRDAAVVLDRQISDAAARVELLRRNDRLRRTGRDAGAAAAAVSTRRRIHRQRQVSQDLAQEEKRTGVALR